MYLVCGLTRVPPRPADVSRSFPRRTLVALLLVISFETGLAVRRERTWLTCGFTKQDETQERKVKGGIPRVEDFSVRLLGNGIETRHFAGRRETIDRLSYERLSNKIK